MHLLHLYPDPMPVQQFIPIRVEFKPASQLQPSLLSIITPLRAISKPLF